MREFLAKSFASLLILLLVAGSAPSASAGVVTRSTGSSIVATGGTITTITENGIIYKVHTFTSSGTFQVVSGSGRVWYLVVAGGGGGGGSPGGSAGSGGGGAGGYLTNDTNDYAVSGGSYTVTVGGGGTGGDTTGTKGTNGEDSVFDSVTATGGGGGGGATAPNNGGALGGSGGGGAGFYGTMLGGAGTVGQGNAGGNGFATSAWTAGGGGGASAVGANGVSAVGGAGGDGLASSISGVSVTYAGGGGGGTYSGGNAAGGAGGGGTGKDNNANGVAGTANTGGGGGGTGSGRSGGDGGSGIVIIRYPVGTAQSKNAPTSGLVGWWTLDNTDVTDKIYDRSGRGNHGYFLNGATTSAKVSGKVGQALQFDGVNDYATSTILDASDSTFSYSFWAKPKQAIGGGNPFSESTTGTAGCNNVNGAISGFGSSPNAAIEISVGTDGVSVNEHSDAHAPIVASYSASIGNSWHHIALVSSSATLMTLYVDGVAVDTALNTARTRTQQIFYMGRKISCVSRFFSGVIDDVRVYNRALSYAEIQQLYRSQQGVVKVNASQNTSLIRGLVGLWSFDGPDMAGVTAYDRSGQGNNGTLTGGPTRVIGKIGQALQFGAANTDSVDINNGSALNPSTVSISAWVKPRVTPQPAAARIFEKAYSNSYYLGTDLGGTKFKGIFANGSSPYGTLESTTSFVAGRWYHLVVTHNGVNDYLYVNGVMEATQSNAVGLNNTSNVPKIGESPIAAGFDWEGIIDEVRIYNRALSAAEAKLLYNLGR